MSERGRILLLSVLILVIVSAAAASLATALLYQAAFEQQRDRLAGIVEHRASILKTVAHFDAELKEEEILGGLGSAEVNEIVDVYKHFATFGETGEFTIARHEGDKIVWLLRSREADWSQTASTLSDSQRSQPMQRALSGASGTMIGIDYRGTKVLAAFEPVPEIGWGIVAKIDVAEINAPFVRAGFLAGGTALFLIAAGVWLNFRLTSPLVQRIEERVAQRTAELLEANRNLRREIGDREQTEAALHRISKVFMEAAAPILIQSPSGTIIDLNAEVERAYGWPRGELIGQPIDKLVPPEHCAREHAFLARCVRGEKIRNVEGWRQAKSGQLIPVLLTFSLLSDEPGEGTGIASIAKDLTEQKRLEEQLRASAAEATMAEERERRKLAVDLHDGVGQLLGLASMKLGALRTSVAAFGLDAAVRELEALVLEVHRRASSLVFQLSPPTLHDVGLVAAAQSLAEDLQRRFGLNVTLEYGEAREHLDETTRITLFRALSELLINVAKHAKTKEAQVRFAWEDGLLKITVEDYGIGFDEAVATGGYGLFSIRERLARLGGSTEIESSPDRGTRVVLSAPIVVVDVEGNTGLE